jgi:hypothetical protein
MSLHSDRIKSKREVETVDRLLAAANPSPWDQATRLVNYQVTALNEALGFADDDKYRVTFGYIGNGRLGSNGWDLTGVRWSVYLPHPDRVGTSDDSLGSVAHGDAEALAELARQVRTFRLGVQWATSRHGMSQHELAKHRNAQVKA